MQPDLEHGAYPRASTYDPRWLLSLDMGPNPLWLLEDLLRDIPLTTSMRVLDLGCGRGASSVFLAREFGVEVWAVDLWIDIASRQKVFRDAQVADTVHVIDADVRSLPFDDNFFDAIISIDAWEYFGTDDHLLPTLLRVLRSAGQLAMATPAMRRDPRELDEIPDHIREVVGWEALAWHSAAWWEQQWRLGGLVTAIEARLQPDGWLDWLRWERAVLASGNAAKQPSIEMLEADGGELLTFAIVSATKR
jgi:cyclopropane fatty-acyl-phospholipid synthase-like methyltransferase